MRDALGMQQVHRIGNIACHIKDGSTARAAIGLLKLPLGNRQLHTPITVTDRSIPGCVTMCYAKVS